MSDSDMLTTDNSLKKSSWLIVTVAQLANLLAAVDATIVNVAMPTIAKSTGAPLHMVGWVITSYTLTLTITLLVMARLGDLLGRARLFSGGFALFTIGSALCALTSSIEMLIIARAVQGVGAASLLANGNALITEHTEGKARGFALGLNSTVVNSGYSLGYVIGGLLVSFADWRWIFTINIPIGIIAQIICIRSLPRLKTKNTAKQFLKLFDLQGAIYSSLALGLCFFSFGKEGGETGAGISSIALAVGGVIALVLFLHRQLRAPYPLMNLSLFRGTGFSIGIFTLFLYTQVFASCSFLFPFYLQGIQGVSPSDVGFMLAPYSVVMSLVAPLTGAWSVRMNPGKLASSGFLLAMAVILFYTFFDALTPLWWLVAGQFGLGFAAALFLSPNRVSVMSSVPQEYLGTASGLMQVVRFLGLSVGTMFSSNMIAGMLASHGGLKGLPGVRGSSNDAVAAFLAGQRTVFIIMSCLLFFGLLLSVWRASDTRKSGENNAT